MSEPEEFRKWFENKYSGRTDFIDEIHKVTSQSEFTVFYGCGLNIDFIVGLWNKSIGKSIDFCCDRNPDKWGKYFCGIKCISPEELIEIADKCAVFISCADRQSVHDSFKDNNFHYINEISSLDFQAADIIPGLGSDALDKITAVFCSLGDKKSESVFKACLKRKFDPFKEESLMRDFYESDTYFPGDLIELSESECFVDAGSYTGDTLAEFLRKVDGKFDNYYAFELDSKSYDEFIINLEKVKGKEKIKILNKGLWSESTTILYTSCGEISGISDEGEKGFVVKLDDVLPKEKVTFLKMDIEGAELNALEGSANMIKEQKPILAICVYHQLQDLWEIPLYIKSLVPEYEIYLRHHSVYDYETVCYAIPSSRRI